MSIVSRYAVPFVDRKSSVIGNILTKTLVGESGSNLIGKLVLVLPTLQSENNSVGFKLSITDSSDDLVFVGNVSGNSSDGYSWLNISSSQTKGLSRYGLPTLFCESKVSAKYNDEGVLVSPEYILKSIQFGDDSTDWGPKLTITIEYLSATLLTALDNDDDNNPNNVSTSTISNFLNNWSISVGSSLTWDTVSTVDQLTRDTGISLNGVVTGTESDGVITTSFTQPWFNELFNTKDGSQIDLSKNTTVQISESANKLSRNVILKNDDSTQEIYFAQTSPTGVATNGLSFDRPGTYNFTTRINQVSLGNWTESNLRYISQKVLQNASSPVNNPLKLGELGLVSNSMNSDLYVGVNYTGAGLQPMLVGGVKVCDNEDDFNNLAIVAGRLVFYNSKLYIGYVPTTGDTRWLEVPTGGGEGGGSSVTMDTIINGPLNYMKTNSEAVDNSGYVKKIGTTGLSGMESSKIINHVLDAEKLNPTYHISESDRQKLNNLPDTGNEYVTRSEFNNELSKKSGINFTGYHDPVSGIVENYDSLPSGVQVDGTRMLVKSPRVLVYTYSSSSSQWINVDGEVLVKGSVVMNISDPDNYSQYYVNNLGNVVSINSGSGFVTTKEFSKALNGCIKTTGTNTLVGNSWSIVNTVGTPSISSSNNVLQLGDYSKKLDIIKLYSTSIPTWNGNDIITSSSINSYVSEALKNLSNYHRPINEVTSSLPDVSTVSDGYRVLLNRSGKIYEKSGSEYISESVVSGDEVFNSSDDSIYSIDESLSGVVALSQIRTTDTGGLSISKVGNYNNIAHSSTITPPEGSLLLKYTLNQSGHITSYEQVTGDDLPPIPVEKITGDLSDIMNQISLSEYLEGGSESNVSPYPGWYSSSAGIASLGLGMGLEVDTVQDEEEKTTVEVFSSRVITKGIPLESTTNGVLRSFLNHQKIVTYEYSSESESVEPVYGEYHDFSAFKPIVVPGSSLRSEIPTSSSYRDLISDSDWYDVLAMGSYDNHGVTAIAVSKSTGSSLILRASGGDNYEWTSVSTLGGSESYTNSDETTVEVGGIPVGSTFNNVSMSDMWTKLLYKFKIATISLTGSTPGGIKEVGTTITSTFTANIVRNNSILSKLEITGPSGSIASTTSETSVTSPEQTITSSSASTIIYRGIATVTNDESETTTTDITSSVSYQFVFPYYIGSTTTPTPNDTQIKALTKEVKAAGNVTHSFTYTSSYVCMAVPVEWVISDIKDASTGLSLMNGFNKSSMTITANGIGHEYSVYVTKEASDADNYTIQFVKG